MNNINNHLNILVKDGTVKIPSVFMFDDFLAITSFLTHARKMNCTIVFENENLTMTPQNDDTYARSKMDIYSVMLGTREFGDAYARYLNKKDQMSWDKVCNGGNE